MDRFCWRGPALRRLRNSCGQSGGTRPEARSRHGTSWWRILSHLCMLQDLSIALPAQRALPVSWPLLAMPREIVAMGFFAWLKRRLVEHSQCSRPGRLRIVLLCARRLCGKKRSHRTLCPSGISCLFRLVLPYTCVLGLCSAGTGLRAGCCLEEPQRPRPGLLIKSRLWRTWRPSSILCLFPLVFLRSVYVHGLRCAACCGTWLRAGRCL